MQQAWKHVTGRMTCVNCILHPGCTLVMLAQQALVTSPTRPLHALFQAGCHKIQQYGTIASHSTASSSNTRATTALCGQSYANMCIDMQLVDEFRQAARNAVDAGFDGVEIHGANANAHSQGFTPNSHSVIIPTICSAAW